MRPGTLIVGTGILCAMLLAQPKQVRIPPLTTEPIRGAIPVVVTGRITDSMCSLADHKSMGMGDTDAECTKACVASHGAQYVLFDGKKVYMLNDQRMPEKFAGQRVTVRGQMDAKIGMIYVTSMAAAAGAPKKSAK